MRTKRYSPLVGGVVFLAITAGSAAAFDSTGSDIADAYLAALEGEFQTITDVGEVVLDGNTVTISSIEVNALPDALPADDETTQWLVDSGSVYTNVTILNGEIDGEALYADETAVERIETSFGPVTVDILGVVDRNVVLGPGWLGGALSLESLQRSEDGTIDSVAVTFAGQPFMTASGISYENDGLGTSRLSSEGAVESMSIDLALVPPEATPVLQALGITELDGAMAASFALDETAGSLVIDLDNLELDNIGAMSFGIGLANFDTRLFDLAMQGDEALMEQLGAQLELIGLRMSLTDGGIREPAMALAAQMIGQQPEALVMMSAMTVGASLAAVGLPELAQQLSGAVQGFLSEGGTISISADPDEPIPFAELEPPADAPPSPEMIKRLNISVERQP